MSLQTVLQAAIELCNDFDSKSDEWEETIRDAEEDAETLQTLTTSMGNVNAPHAYTAGVEGSITDAPSLSDDNFERMPKNEKKKCQLYRDNNIKSTDCPFTLNGSKKDVKIKMYSMMLEARIGNKVENLKKGTKLPEEFRSKDQAELDFMNSSFDGGQLKEEDMPIGFTIPVVVSSSSSSSNNTNNNNGTTTSSSTTTPSSSSSSTLPTAAAEEARQKVAQITQRSGVKSSSTTGNQDRSKFLRTIKKKNSKGSSANPGSPMRTPNSASIAGRKSSRKKDSNDAIPMP